MARGKKSGPSRMDLRRQNEAAEAQEAEDEDETDDEESDEEEESDESEESEGGEDDGGEDEEAPKPKKKPAKKAAAKKPAAKRTRVKEPPRMRAIWVIFDNASKRVKEFPYAQKADAERVLAEKQEEKKGTFYLQLVKEPMDS